MRAARGEPTVLTLTLTPPICCSSQMDAESPAGATSASPLTLPAGTPSATTRSLQASRNCCPRCSSSGEASACRRGRGGRQQADRLGRQRCAAVRWQPGRCACSPNQSVCRPHPARPSAAATHLGNEDRRCACACHARGPAASGRQLTLESGVQHGEQPHFVSPVHHPAGRPTQRVLGGLARVNSDAHAARLQEAAGRGAARLEAAATAGIAGELPPLATVQPPPCQLVPTQCALLRKRSSRNNKCTWLRFAHHGRCGGGDHLCAAVQDFYRDSSSLLRGLVCQSRRFATCGAIWREADRPAGLPSPCQRRSICPSHPPCVHSAYFLGTLHLHAAGHCSVAHELRLGAV